MTANEQIIHPIGHFMTPESEGRTHYFFRWVRNHDVHNEELSTLAGAVRTAAAATSEPGKLFVRPSAAVKGAAEKLVAEGSSINDYSVVLREVLS